MALNFPSSAKLTGMFNQVIDLINVSGEDVVIRERTAAGAYTDHPAIKARATAMRMEDLIAGSPAKQGDLYLICDARKFPVARRLAQGDRVTFRGRDYAVINDDADQYSVAGTVLARKLHVRG